MVTSGGSNFRLKLYKIALVQGNSNGSRQHYMVFFNGRGDSEDLPALRP